MSDTLPELPERKINREVTTVEELQSLDEKQIVRGYRAGLTNDPSYGERDKGYWHGFLNGLVDGRHVGKPSDAQAALARAYVVGGALRADVQRWSKA